MTKELVQGITLAERLRTMGRLPWIEAVSHMTQILEALSFAHSQGIIHRNVTPETIIINENTTVKLNGFDLAKPMSSPSLTQTGSVLGALKYIPPEQIRGLGPLDARSDLYSVGVVLYEALTGRLPFDSNSQFKVMLDHVNAEPPAPSSLNPKLPGEFDSILLKALAKDPDDRFQTAEEFRGQLEYVKSMLRGKPAGAPAVNSSIEERAYTPAETERPAAKPAAAASRRAEAVAGGNTASPVGEETAIPSFGVATITGAGTRGLLLLILGVSSVGAIFALLLALGKL
jgi:eukaryotic-like serine/threonine-protein kinase